MKSLSHLILLTVCCVVFSNATAQENLYKFLKKINLPGDGKWDYLKINDDMEQLYVSHGDRVQVININNDMTVVELKGLSKVHGISFGEAEKKVYVANTGENNVVIYDAISFDKISTVDLPNGKKPDCILFDKFSQKAFVFCGDSHNAFVIDGKTNEVVAVIQLGGVPEFACTDDAGFIYNNIEDTNEVVVIDVKLNNVVKRYSLAPDKAPTGITIDTKNNLLLVACAESNKLVVLSQSTGKRIATLPIGEKCDGLVYDKNSHLIITANGAGSATIIKQEAPDRYSVIQTLITQPGLKTIEHSDTTHKFYITGADFKDGKTIAPGTFSVFVYGLSEN